MYPFRTLSHAQLLDLAHGALEAAHDHDFVRVGSKTLQLFVALNDHVLAERPAFLCLPPGDARILGLGQQRIVYLLGVLADSAAGGMDRCGCSRTAHDLIAELEAQAAEERRYLVAAVD